VDQFYTKSYQGFRDDSLLHLDFIYSAMDLNEIGLARAWPGEPVVVHWKIPDPMKFIGRVSGRRNHFRNAYTSLAKRIELLTSLPLEKVLAFKARQQVS